MCQRLFGLFMDSTNFCSRDISNGAFFNDGRTDDSIDKNLELAEVLTGGDVIEMRFVI